MAAARDNERATVGDDIPTKVRRRNGPRYAHRAEVQPDLTESLRTFSEHTDGLTNRLPLSGIGQMRAGTQNNPFSLARRYLVAGRTAGLPKSWGQHYAVWAQRQVDFLWPMESTPLKTLEEKAMLAEYLDNVAEKRKDLEYSAITLRECIQTQTAELVADQLRLARLERELEDCR